MYTVVNLNALRSGAFCSRVQLRIMDQQLMLLLVRDATMKWMMLLHWIAYASNVDTGPNRANSDIVDGKP